MEQAGLRLPLDEPMRLFYNDVNVGDRIWLANSSFLNDEVIEARASYVVEKEAGRLSYDNGGVGCYLLDGTAHLEKGRVFSTPEEAITDWKEKRKEWLRTEIERLRQKVADTELKLEQVDGYKVRTVDKGASYRAVDL